MAAVKKTKEERINELEELTPELPENFREWCGEKFKAPEIYYKRKGNFAECACGKCGEKYIIYTPKEPEYGTLYDEIPRRGERAVCKKCGNISTYQWKRITEPVRESASFYLYQRSKDNNLFVRIFTYHRKYSQFSEMEGVLKEDSRYFLQMGKVEKMIHAYLFGWGEHQWIMSDRTGYPNLKILNGDLYPGWREEIKQSELKYFPEKALVEIAKSNWGRPFFNAVSLTDALMTYANNPAVEMYCKMGMHKLASHLVWREGRSGFVNRKKDTLQGQLRLKKKENVNKVIKAAGDINLLKMLQFEEKEGYVWKPEQEEWIADIFDQEMKKRIKHLLKYMTLQQLINRTEKYAIQKYSPVPEGWKLYGNYKRNIVQEYDDYLCMRETLGYDMANSVFIYPRDLDQVHGQMVEERNARHDEFHIKKKNKEFPDIAKRYESLCKKYQAATEGYIIRPAKDAGEIIMEGRKLHHCVGGDNYLSKHNKGTTTILFLRKEKTPNTPYITIEISGTKIRQWYGAHDKKPKQEFFDRLLADYTKQLEEREKKPDKTLTAAG